MMTGHDSDSERLRCDACDRWRPRGELDAVPPNPLCVKFMCRPGLPCGAPIEYPLQAWQHPMPGARAQGLDHDT